MKTKIINLIFILSIVFFNLGLFSETSQRTNPVKMDKESIETGKNIFITYCAGCHGLRADGRGPQALNLLPRPQNLRNSPFVKYLSDERFFSSISGGVRGTSMPAFEMILKKKDRWHAINYIRSISYKDPVNMQNSIKSEPGTEDKNPVKSSPDSIARGEKLYKQYCMSCHGTSIDGKGKTALNLIPRPRNLVVITSWGEKPFLDYLDNARILDAILHGVSGTSMSPWGMVIGKIDIWNIINYLRAEAKKGNTNYDQSFTE